MNVYNSNPYPYSYAKGVYQATLKSLPNIGQIPGVKITDYDKFYNWIQQLEKQNEAMIENHRNTGAAFIAPQQ